MSETVLLTEAEINECCHGRATLPVAIQAALLRKLAAHFKDKAAVSPSGHIFFDVELLKLAKEAEGK